jgi:cobalt-zinc-cadmium efflux system outer membrane protein
MRLRFTTVLIAFVPFAPSSFAMEKLLTLRQALALTLKQNPELAAFSWDVRSAEARVLQARLFPNPDFNTQTEDIAGTKQSSDLTRSQTTLQLSQLIELGGKRSARVR